MVAAALQMLQMLPPLPKAAAVLLRPQEALPSAP
jgi:hypothetical protein